MVDGLVKESEHSEASLLECKLISNGNPADPPLVIQQVDSARKLDTCGPFELSVSGMDSPNL